MAKQREKREECGVAGATIGVSYVEDCWKVKKKKQKQKNRKDIRFAKTKGLW